MKLYYQEKGSGQTMILLHGNGEDSSYFAGQIPVFSRRYRVIAVDTRGHGKSPRGTKPFSLLQFAEDLKELLDQKGLRKVILMGFSDGGNIALLFALKYPEYVDRMILNGANLTPFGVKASVQLPILAGYGTVAAFSLAAACLPGKILPVEARQELKHKRELLGLMVKGPWIRPGDLNRLRMPVLVIAGSRDMIRECHTRTIRRALPDGCLKILKGSHFVASENPEAFNRAVGAFLEATEGGEAVRMKRLWENRTPKSLDQKIRTDSAVLVPLVKKNGEYHVLFEVRADQLKSQPGEICFPGGAVEDGETAQAAAIRETMEELLIGREQIELLAPLDILPTSANLTVWPFLGILKGYGGTFSTDEVERVFTVPLRWLAENEPECYHTEVVTVPGEDFPFDRIPDGKEYHWRKGRYEILFYQYENTVIWGMTAKILYSFITMYRKDIRRQPLQKKEKSLEELL